MKRIISIIVTLALVLMAVAVPALAVDELTVAGPPAYNFLDSTGYYRYQVGLDTYESSHRSFAISYATTLTRLDGFSWCPVLGDYEDMNIAVQPSKNGELMNVGYITYTFYSSVEIGSVFIEFYDEIGGLNSIEGRELGVKRTYQTIDPGYYYTYSFDIDRAIYTAFSFDIAFKYQYDAFEFESVALYRSNYIKRVDPISNLCTEGKLFNRLDGVYYIETIHRLSNFGIDSYELNSSENNFPSDDRLLCYFDFDQYSFVGADKFTFTFITPCVFENYYDYGSGVEIGITVEDVNYNVYNIPLNVYFSKLEQYGIYGDSQFIITVTADLSSYDLSDASFILSIVLNARQPYPNNEFKYFAFDVVNQFFYFGYEENYNEEDRFFERLTQWWSINVGRFLTNGFNGIVDGINEALAHLDVHLTNELQDSVSSIENHLDDKFDSLFEKMDEYFGVPEDTAPPDSSDQQQGIEDSIGEMDDIADQFGTAGDQIDQLLPDTPNYNDTGLADNADLAATNISYVLMVFNPLWENELIITVLTFSCMLALGGFILFGER